MQIVHGLKATIDEGCVHTYFTSNICDERICNMEISGSLLILNLFLYDVSLNANRMGHSNRQVDQILGTLARS